MKVIEFIKKSNRKKNLSSDRLLELKQYYMSMYRHYMMQMYDKGYISDPTVFDKKQILMNIVDLKVKGIYNISGVLQLNSKWVEYAYHKNDNEEVKDFLNVLYDVLKYREYSNDLDMFYEKFGLSVNLQLTQEGARVSSKSSINISRGCLCSMIPSGKTLKVVNIRDSLWEQAMEILGIPEEDWYIDGLFDSDLSHEQEVNNINIILEGKIKCDGKYSSNLEDWLFKHKWSSDGMSINKQGLVSYIYSSKSNKVFEALSEKLNSVEPNKVLAFQGDEIYLIEDIVNYKIPISHFALISGYEDTLVCESNYLYGYIGEAYDTNYLEEEKIGYIGIPIKIVTEGNEEYLIDREQVDIHTETWFSIENVDFYYEESDLKNPYKDENSLNYKMFEIFKNAQKGIIGSISLEEHSLKEIEKSKKQVSAKIIKGV